LLAFIGDAVADRALGAVGVDDAFVVVVLAGGLEGEAGGEGRRERDGCAEASGDEERHEGRSLASS
jgi:hypothetical protein